MKYIIIVIMVAILIIVPPAFSQNPRNNFLIRMIRDRNSWLDKGDAAKAWPLIEKAWQGEYEQYFRRGFKERPMTVRQMLDILAEASDETGRKIGVLYILPRGDRLNLVLATSNKRLTYKRVDLDSSETLSNEVKKLYENVTNIRRKNDNYLAPAQQLYKWLIAPLDYQLKSQGIQTLIFCVGNGLRTLPYAALHDGQRFLIEKYSLAQMPTLKVSNMYYKGLKNARVLAMGASEFKEQSPLPAVPVELSTITQELWKGQKFLNEKFTLANLEKERNADNIKIIHLATHADFQSGIPGNSYIQFWNQKLTLEQMGSLGWNDPQVELLVLSACKTAIGDKGAELGFAGLAIQSGVKSALASLWYVSDQGTLALMTEFYRQLQTAGIKAEALQKAQIAMLKEQIRLEPNQLSSPRGVLPLPPELVVNESKMLSHPYYWAAFTMIGSPW